jgi:molybdenum cofactor biosynthesis enzyme MoaA
MSEDVEFLPRQDILSFEEIIRLATSFAQLGVTKIRLTGGEPLMRKKLPELVAPLFTQQLRVIPVELVLFLLIPKISAVTVIE